MFAPGIEKKKLFSLNRFSPLLNSTSSSKKTETKSTTRISIQISQGNANRVLNIFLAFAGFLLYFLLLKIPSDPSHSIIHPFAVLRPFLLVVVSQK